MLEQEKVIKLEICTIRGNLLMTVTGNYSFPVRADGTRNVMMLKGKNLPVFAKGAFLNVVAYMRSGDRLNYPAIIDISTEGQLNLSMRFDRVKVLEERRRYYKVETSEPCRMILITREDIQTELDPPIPAVIKNINLGGVFLHMPQQPLKMEVNDAVTVEVPNMAGSRVELVLKVLRVQNDAEGKLVGYGCCYLFLDAKQEQVIAKYINKLQIEKRKLERAQE